VLLRNEANMYPVFMDLQNWAYEFMGIHRVWAAGATPEAAPVAHVFQRRGAEQEGGGCGQRKTSTPSLWPLGAIASTPGSGRSHSGGYRADCLM